MKKAYYAHPMSLYDTPQEERDLEMIQQLGLLPVNPNRPYADEGYKTLGMDYFTQLVKSCEVLVFHAFPCGKIPAGVVKEISVAMNMGIPVLELPSGVIERALSIEATRQRLLESGQR